jgi:hypothetical protein
MIPSSRSGPTAMTTSGPSIPIPDERPDWQTESRHPCQIGCSNREPCSTVSALVPPPATVSSMWTRAVLTTPPRSLCLATTVAALEVLGLVQAVRCTSSYSGGLHLYFPFDTEQKTWAIAWRSPLC